MHILIILLYTTIEYTLQIIIGEVHLLPPTETITPVIDEAHLCYKTQFGKDLFEMAINKLRDGIDPPRFIFVDLKVFIYDNKNHILTTEATHFMHLVNRQCKSTLSFSKGSYEYQELVFKIIIHTGNVNRPIDSFTAVFNNGSSFGLKPLSGNIFLELLVEFNSNQDVIHIPKEIETEEIMRFVRRDVFSSSCACFVCRHKIFLVDYLIDTSSRTIRPYSEFYFDVVDRGQSIYTDSCAAWPCRCRNHNIYPLRRIFVSERDKLLNIIITLVPFQYPHDHDILTRSRVPRQDIRISVPIVAIHADTDVVNKDQYLYLVETEDSNYLCMDNNLESDKPYLVKARISRENGYFLEIRQKVPKQTVFGFTEYRFIDRQTTDACLQLD